MGSAPISTSSKTINGNAPPQLCGTTASHDNRPAQFGLKHALARRTGSTGENLPLLPICLAGWIDTIHRAALTENRRA
jgi:hypothetical protein